MSDFTWYTRLLVWVGATVLLIEAVMEGISGAQPFGLVTVLAVIMLAAGLLLFVGGLAFEGCAVQLQFAPISEARPELIQDDSVGTIALFPDREPAMREADRHVVEPTPLPQATVVERAAMSAPEPAVSRLAASPRGATTIEVTESASVIGRPCFRCHESLRAGHTAALCPDCGGAHHATCWVGNHFHCAREGCGGQGGLQAPNT